jgi:hypothetical protein
VKARKSLVPLVLLLVLLVAASGLAAIGIVHRDAPATASAEEQGLSASLHYVDGYSNWGPTDVYGSAVLWPHDDVAAISVHFLPRLTDGAKYMWWVVNTVTGKAVNIGAFNTSNAGDAAQDVYPRAPMPAGANGIVVTMWRPGDSIRALGSKRALAGQFPLPPAPTAVGALPLPLPRSGVPGTPSPSLVGPGGSAVPRQPTYIHPLKLPVPVARLPQTGGGPFAGAPRQPRLPR